MRIGGCGNIDDGQKFKDAGFAYLEVNVQSVLNGKLSDAEWAKVAPNPDKFVLPVEAANCLVPGDLPIVGPKRDMTALREYMQRVARRAKQVGIARLVFGSGGARKRPEGMDPAQAMAEITEFTRLAGEACAAQDVVVAIEHLHAGETNTLNKLAQTRALCDAVGQRSVGVLVDTYHYGLERETGDAILKLGDRLQHVHVAEPVKRVHPGAHGPVKPGGDAFDFTAFFCLLRKIGYDQRVSFEGAWGAPFEAAAPGVVKLLRQAWDDAGRCE